VTATIDGALAAVDIGGWVAELRPILLTIGHHCFVVLWAERSEIITFQFGHVVHQLNKKSADRVDLETLPDPSRPYRRPPTSEIIDQREASYKELCQRGINLGFELLVAKVGENSRFWYSWRW
jgi:hypothetical protein